MLVSQEDAHCIEDFLWIRASPDIQEVGRTAASQFDAVHRCHGQTCAVDHAADLPGQADKAQAGGPGFQLIGSVLLRVAEPNNIRMLLDTIVIEPWRARAFPVIRDLMVDRSAFDKLIQEGGYVSVNTGSAPDANSIPIKKKNAELSMDAAACIGCGACVAACKNASAMLFVGAKVSHLALLPQGKIEAKDRVMDMVCKMDELGFGNCTNTGACEAECPKGIKLTNIARLNREYFSAIV